MKLKIKLPTGKVENSTKELDVQEVAQVTSIDKKKSEKLLDLNNFELQSEYVEKDVRLPDLSVEQKDAPEQTIIKVVREEGVQTVTPQELKQIIKNGKDIKKVVVEKLSINEASRVTLQYSPKKDGQTETLANDESTLLSYVPDTKEVKFADNQYLKDISLLEFEFILNAEFIKPINNPFTKKDRPELKIKDQEIKNETDSNVSWFDRNEDSSDYKRVEYERHTLLKKKGKQHNGYYYRAKDHVELFKTGSSYLKDFKDGEKNFSFVSTGLDQVREKTVFGIASFFNYHSDCKVAIVTDHFEKSFYQQFVGELEKEEKTIVNEDLPFYIYAGNGFDLIEYTVLRQVERKIKEADFETFIEKLVDQYDLILWDLPEIESMKANKELYFPMIRVIDNVSLIVSENKTKFVEMQKIIDYFRRYQIRVKGMLYHREVDEKEKAA